MNVMVSSLTTGAEKRQTHALGASENAQRGANFCIGGSEERSSAGHESRDEAGLISAQSLSRVSGKSAYEARRVWRGNAGENLSRSNCAASWSRYAVRAMNDDWK